MRLPEKWEIIYYEDRNGGSPIEEFIDGLPSVMHQARVLAVIGLLEEHGVGLHRHYADLLEDGIHELRVRVGRLRYRILYFYWQRNKIVLTHGFAKTTRRVPEREIRRARRYREEWLSRRKTEKR